MKRIITFWYGCWKASFNTKVGETRYWVQYYNIWTNSVRIVRKLK